MTRHPASTRPTGHDPRLVTIPVAVPPPRQTLVSNVVEQLSRQIGGGQVAPGSKLPTEIELCSMFEVSRTVVREAVAQLKAEDLVESVQGLGVYVKRRTPGQGVLRLRGTAGSRLESAREMLDFRAGLETQAARLAAERCTAADVRAMRRALARLDEAERAGDDGAAEDLAFHMAVANASKNAFIVQVQQFLGESLRDAIAHSRDIADAAMRAAHFETARREHGRVVEAIAARDPVLASRRMHEHLSRGQDRLLATAANDPKSVPHARTLRTPRTAPQETAR